MEPIVCGHEVLAVVSSGVGRQRRAGEQGRPGYAVFETGRTLRKKRRFWVRPFVYALLLALVTALGGFAYLSASVFDEAGDEPSEQQQAAVEQEEEGSQ